MRYELRQKSKNLTTSEVLVMREGVDRHYSALFAEMCSDQGIAVRTIRGFVKGHEYRPGYEFIAKEDEVHEWNAVQILGSWRLIDPSLGSGFTDASGNFNQRLNEHFFLPDPEVLIWTHFPCNQLTPHSVNWQLIEKPISLKEFNALPRVMPQFFEYNLYIRSKQTHPYEFRVQAEVQIGAQEPMRYKYKLFPADQVENESLNHFALCQLKENRLVGSFIVTPPLEARYFLKVRLNYSPLIMQYFDEFFVIARFCLS
jgi:transglutaminase/protease-like cytokinesis protein 3